MLKIIPLGGLGEIGLNMMVIEYDDVMFIIDAGLMFPEDYMLGVDIVIPAMDYIRENKDKVQAVILTHAHEDHIGALPYLLKEIRLPVYGTAFTLGIVRNKLIEFELNKYIDLNLVNPGETLTIDPFEIEFIRVGHSTADGVGLAIKTPEGVVVHTGDFKISHDADPLKNTDISAFARFIIAAPGRVVVALFESNVFRIQQVIEMAVRCHRKVIFNGRSMDQIIAVATELGYIHS